MQCSLMVNSSERNELHKAITGMSYYECKLIDDTSITQPSLLIEAANISGFNYCYIPSFNRYYYIKEITSVTNSLWRVDCYVDVLMSFKNQILSSYALISENTSVETSYYLSSDSFVSTVKDLTDIIPFTNGLLDNGEYILITAGGL